MGTMMRPRKRGGRKAAGATDAAEQTDQDQAVAVAEGDAPVDDSLAATAVLPPTEDTGGEAVAAQELAQADEQAEVIEPSIATETGGVAESPAVTPTRTRFIINLNMLSNVDVKFFTEGDSRDETVARWKQAIGRAKRERPEDTVEVTMGDGTRGTSFIFYLAEVTGFAVGPYTEDTDAIPSTVNV